MYAIACCCLHKSSSLLHYVLPIALPYDVLYPVSAVHILDTDKVTSSSSPTITGTPDQPQQQQQKQKQQQQDNSLSPAFSQATPGSLKDLPSPPPHSSQPPSGDHFIMLDIDLGNNSKGGIRVTLEADARVSKPLRERSSWCHIS